jgi:hypothetical protein
MILYHIISYYIILHHITSYYIILNDIIPYYIILDHIISTVKGDSGPTRGPPACENSRMGSMGLSLPSILSGGYMAWDTVCI